MFHLLHLPIFTAGLYHLYLSPTGYCFCSAFCIRPPLVVQNSINDGRYQTLLEGATLSSGVDESNRTEIVEIERPIDKGQLKESNGHSDEQYQPGWKREARQGKGYNSDEHDQNKDESRKEVSPAMSSSSYTIPQMFLKFVDSEKKRMQNVIQYEQSRMKEIESFLAKEKLRLKNLEQFEKYILSNVLIDEAVNTLSSSFSPIIQQQSRDNKVGHGWEKIVVPKQMKVDDQGYVDDSDHDDSDYVYIYEPKMSRLSSLTERPPSMIICFLGGAGIGEFPQILYSTFLRTISEKLNATIITVPYRIHLNHYELSKQTNDLFKRAIASYEEKLYHISSEQGQKEENDVEHKGNEVKMIMKKDRNQKKQLPLYFLGHSLELHYGKCEKDPSNSDIDQNKNGAQYHDFENIAGVGFIAYNNFGFRDTTKQIKSFSSSLFNQDSDQYTEEANIQTSEREPRHPRLGLDSIIEFSEQAMSMTGLEFSPSPSDTYEILSTKYRQKKALLGKTRLFVFDEDKLDSTESIVEAMDGNMENISVSELPGSHLSPVFVNFLDLGVTASDDINLIRYNTISKVVKDVLLVDGIQGLISYGDEDSLSSLIEEVCEWVEGKGPSKGSST